jgi:hypothetical protein
MIYLEGTVSCLKLLSHTCPDDDCINHEQEYTVDSDSFTQFSQDSDIDIFDCICPDSEIYEPDMSNSCNSDDGQMNAN